MAFTPLQLSIANIRRKSIGLPTLKRAEARAPVFMRWLLLFRERASVTVVTGEIFIDRVDMEKAVAFRVQLLELLAAALGEDDVAGVAIAGLDLRLAVGGFVQAVVTSKTPGLFLVAKIIRIGSPVCFHFRKEVGLV